jgi:hypothetical protein
MFEESHLRDHFESLMCRTQAAADGYESALRGVADLSLRERLGKLQREKLRHVQLLERLLEIVD